jgi:hypothetical protein
LIRNKSHIEKREVNNPSVSSNDARHRAIILAEGIDVIESVLEKYGIDIDLDGDGK